MKIEIVTFNFHGTKVPKRKRYRFSQNVNGTGSLRDGYQFNPSSNLPLSNFRKDGLAINSLDIGLAVP